MVCLDTDIMVAFFRGDPAAIKKINDFSKFGIQLSTTPINVCELYIGAYKSKKPEENMKMIEDFLQNLICLNLNFNQCKLIGFLSNELRVKGSFIGEMDILVAGLSILYDEVLVTRNTKHFEIIEGLRVEKW